MSAEDVLEAAIWSALTAHKVTCTDAPGLVDDLTLAARLYAAGDSDDLTALRREILHRDTAETRGQT